MLVVYINPHPYTIQNNNVLPSTVGVELFVEFSKELFYQTYDYISIHILRTGMAYMVTWLHQMKPCLY